MIRSRLTRALHYSLLDCFSFEQVAEFWRRHPLEIKGQTLSEADKLRFITTPKSLIPSKFFFVALHDAERFCCDKGFNFKAFINLNNSFYAEKSAFLVEEFQFFNKIFFGLLRFTTLNPLCWVLKQIPMITKYLISDYRHDIVYYQRTQYHFHFTFKAWTLDPNNGYHLFDHTNYTVDQLKKVATFFDFRPMDYVEVICDHRKVRDILWSGVDHKVDGDTLYIEGQPAGVRKPFLAILEGRECFKTIVEERKTNRDFIIQMTKDYTCPYRKRKVLCSGGVYESPFSLTNVVISGRNDERFKVKQCYKKCMQIVVGAKEHPENIYKKKNQKFLHYLDTAKKQVNTFHYYTTSDKMAYNNRLLVKKVMARILLKILQIYQSGQKTIEFWEFTTDKELFPESDSAFLTRRIERLTHTLEKKKAGIRLVKAGRGKICVSSTEDFLLEVHDE